MGNKCEGWNVELKKNSVKDYEKIVLTSGDCDLFMPMSFMVHDGIEEVTYDCSGFTRLKGYQPEGIKELLDIIESTFMILSRSGGYFIPPGKITVNEDTVFYNKEKRKVKLAYIPVEEKATSLRENMITFLSEMASKTEERHRGYIQSIIRHLKENNYYVRDIIDLIIQLKREVYLCRIQ